MPYVLCGMCWKKVVTDYPVFPAKPNMEEVKTCVYGTGKPFCDSKTGRKIQPGQLQDRNIATILSAVSSEKLNLVVSVLKKEETDEEAEEDPADQLALFQ